MPHQVPILSIPLPYPVPNSSPLRSNQNLDLLPEQVQNPAKPNSRKTPTYFPQHFVPDSELSDNNNLFRGNPGEHLQPNSIPTPDSQHLNVDVPLHDLESNRTGCIPAQSSYFPLTYQPSLTLTSSNIQTPQVVAPIKLKGVDLPVCRLPIKTLTVLKNWKKLQQDNLKDLEEFLNVSDRTLIVLKDTCDLKGDLLGQSLNLSSKEKLPEEDVQHYKAWLLEHSKEDTLDTS